MSAQTVPDGARGFRGALLSSLIAAGDLRTPRVTDAMAKVERHLFVPGGVPLILAYADTPLPIGYNQTISQPTIVAMMTEALELTGTERVLEIGTGSGYQAAVLSLLAAEVFSIELVEQLATDACQRLARLRYANVIVRVGDGCRGWPEAARFDRILLTAAPTAIPQALLDQLADGGVLVAPVGGERQSLLRLRRRGAELSSEDLGPVRFVPMQRSA